MCRGQDLVQRTVLSQQGRRGLLPDAGHTGQAVGRVTAQQREFGVGRPGPFDWHAVLLGDFARAEQGGLGQAAAQVQHPDRDGIVGDDLQ